MSPDPTPDTPPDIEAIRAVVRMSRMLERACEDLSLAHYRVLAAVAAGEERATHVAARLALGKPTVSASVDALCRRGLIVRADVAGDQRAAALRVTDEGRHVLAESESAMLARLTAVLDHSGDGDAIRDSLGRLGNALDRYSADVLAERVAKPAVADPQAAR